MSSLVSCGHEDNEGKEALQRNKVTLFGLIFFGLVDKVGGRLPRLENCWDLESATKERETDVAWT